MMIAIEAGPEAAPARAHNTLKPTRLAMFQERAIRAADAVETSNPQTYMRLWPRVSATLPIKGVATPNVSIAPVSTQLAEASDTRRSSAIRGIEAETMVMRNPVEKNPTRATISTTQRRS